jgi:hypothetical protein
MHTIIRRFAAGGAVHYAEIVVLVNGDGNALIEDVATPLKALPAYNGVFGVAHNTAV